MSILLSICIPTYNRPELVERLVASLLSVLGDFEVCVHDDGSPENMVARLAALRDKRLCVSRAENAGRAQALCAAVDMARGRYVMLLDDDDFLYSSGLRAVLSDCAGPLPKSCAGFIYHLNDNSGRRVGSSFKVGRSNLVALRADHAVTGDKKEVVLRSTLVAAMRVLGRPRRVPTSLYWARIATTHDVLCRDLVIGRKTYLEDGMSDRIKALKSANPAPMYLLARARVGAFASGRYKSRRFMLRSVGSAVVYKWQMLWNSLLSKRA